MHIRSYKREHTLSQIISLGIDLISWLLLDTLYLPVIGATLQWAPALNRRQFLASRFEVLFCVPPPALPTIFCKCRFLIFISSFSLFSGFYIRRHVPTSRWRCTGQPQPMGTNIHAHCPPGCQGIGDHLSLDLFIDHRGLHKKMLEGSTDMLLSWCQIFFFLYMLQEMKKTPASHEIWIHCLLEGSYLVPCSLSASFFKSGGRQLLLFVV